MGGGLMQLVAYGAQDVYLTGNPQITFFKVVYRRHTNFSIEAIEQSWNGAPQGSDGRCTSIISRNGDLIHRMYLEITAELAAGASGKVFDKPNPGAYLVNYVELEIGGQKIDKHYGHWLETWAELTQLNNEGLCGGTNASLTHTEFQRVSGMGGVVTAFQTTATDKTHRIFVPLQFWFCRNPGLALPLIALQYHEVKVTLDHKMGGSLHVNPAAGTNQLWVDYIYLDTDERRRFAQVSHEYLIEQVQHSSFKNTTSGKNILSFNHPVKELIWTGEVTDGAKGSVKLAKEFTLKLNGQDRFSLRDYRYFSRVKIWEHHTGSGGIDTTAGSARWDDSICVYSFALKPEEHQPSGTCNFSRIDNAQLISSIGRNLEVYAINYNVFRVMSGMGGLAYSN